MALYEEDMFDDLAYDEAEGAADAFGDEFDEFDEFAEADEFDEFDEFDEYDEFDEFDEADEFGGFEDEEEDALDNAMAYALGAEDADEFLGRVFKGIKKAAQGVGRFAKKAAPVVGRIARAATPVLGMIPHPAAQAAAKAGKLLGRLRMEGASEEETLEAMAELAVHDRRALPVVAGLAARTVLKGTGARMTPMARKRAVKQVKAAAKTLVARRGPQAIRALPKIAKSVKRTAAVKGTPPAMRPKVLQNATKKVAASPALAKKLSRPMPGGRLPMRGLGPRGPRARRSFVIQGPARITVRPI